MKRKRKINAFFTGHRNIDNYWASDIDGLISLALEVGVTKFFVGMALGTDQVAAEILIKRHLHWIAVIPCADQHKLWKPRQQSHYLKLLEKATETVTLYPTYSHGVMQSRNAYMVKRSRLCLAVWDGREEGGTYLTIKMAKAKNLPIARLSPTFPKTEQRFSLIEPEYKQLSLFQLNPNGNQNNVALSHCKACN